MIGSVGIGFVVLLLFGELSAAAFCPGIGLFVTALAMIIAARFMPRKADPGAEAAARWSAFREYLLGLGEVLAVYHMAGENDFLVHVMARDPGHLRDIALDHLITRTEVGHIETWLMFDHVRGLGASLGSSDAT